MQWPYIDGQINRVNDGHTLQLPEKITNDPGAYPSNSLLRCSGVHYKQTKTMQQLEYRIQVHGPYDCTWYFKKEA